MLALVWAAQHFRSYLYGRKFLARTDHNSLKWLKSFREPIGQVARWLEILSEFEFTVEHRPGQKHINADALSRVPCKQCGQVEDSGLSPENETSLVATTSDKWIPAWTTAELKNAQQSDPDIQQMITWIEMGSVPKQFPRQVSHRLQTFWAQRQSLKVLNGVLHRLWEDVPHGGLNKQWQLVLPQSLIKNVLQELHDSPTSGHMGVMKTLGKIRSRYYWAGQRKDVEDWCKNCTKCTSRKSPVKHRQAAMQIDTSGRPLQRVAMDILGPLPVTACANKYILVIGDYFTKWTEAFPMKDMEATTIAKIFVDQFVCRFGVPEYLHTDQGRNFESNLIKELCQILGVHKTRTTPYHPQSDGMVERFNRTVLNMLSIALVGKDEKTWDLHLPMVMMAYRTSIHETTGTTPFSLMFGREVCLPVDLMYGSPEPMENFPNTARYAMDMRSRLETAYHKVREHMQNQQRRQKDNYDKKVAGLPFKLDDHVWLHCPAVHRGHSRKLHRPWKGPFVIKKVISDNLYKIHPQGAPRRQRVVHFNRLKPYNSPPPPVSDAEKATPVEILSESRSERQQKQQPRFIEEEGEDRYILMPEPQFDHTRQQQMDFEEETEDSDTLISDQQSRQTGSSTVNTEDLESESVPQLQQLRRSTRQRRQPDRGPFVTHCIDSNMKVEPSPRKEGEQCSNEP